MNPIIIDPEFRALIPPLPEESLKHLHNCISAHGCRDKLVVWKKHNILLDGHNRYDFCKANGIPFETVEQFHGDRESAKNWMRINQLGRRNLLPIQFKKITGDLYNSMKRTKNDGGKGTPKATVGQLDLSASSAEIVAKQQGVSPRSVKRAGKLSDAIQTLGISAEVTAGTCRMKPAEIMAKASGKKPVKDGSDWKKVVDGFKKLPFDQMEKAISEIDTIWQAQ
jgi:hypothetical protein